jgi:mannosyltransferase
VTDAGWRAAFERRMPAVSGSDGRPVVLVTGLAIVVMFIAIGAKSFWFDEAFSALVAWDGFRHLPAAMRGVEVNMAGYYVLLTGWLKLGHSDAWIRAMSAVFAVATVPLVWWTGRRLFGARVALMATLLLVMNAFFVAYAQEARAYSLAAFSAALATWLLVRAMERPSARSWALYGLAAGWLPYTYILAATLLVGHGLAVLAARDRAPWRVLALAAVVAAIVMAPLALAALGVAGDAAPSARPTTLAALADVLARVAGAMPGRLPSVPADIALSIGVALVFLAGATICLTRTWAWRGRQDPWPGYLALACAATPVVIIVVVSLLRPLLVARYLIVALPGIALVMALAIDRIPRPVVRFAVLAVLVGLLAFGTIRWYRDDDAKADWRSATAALQAGGTAEDRLMIQEPWTWRAIDYYVRQAGARGRQPVRLWRGLNANAPDYAAQLERSAAATAAERRILWVVSNNTGRGFVDPATDPLFAGVRRHYRSTDVQRFNEVTLTRFEPRS